MPQVNVTLTIPESARDHGKDLAREIGVNPTKFLSACLQYGIASVNAETYSEVAKIMQTNEQMAIESNMANFFGATTNKAKANTTTTKAEEKAK